ncbi:MAG: PAS domain S-box protein [Candidatus Hodarchaeales archaeon]
MIRILHVDDDDNILNLTKIYLEKISCRELEVDSLEDPQKTLVFIQEKDYDCIVCDYEMPNLDGLELLHQIRTLNTTIPFIIFTGRSREDVAIKALNLGANRYIKKGGEPKSQFSELIHSIKDIVRHDRMEQKLHESEVKSRAILKAIPDYIFLLKEDGEIIDYEGALTEQIGDVTQLIGSNVADHAPKNTSEQINKKLKEALLTGETQQFFYNLPSSDGDRHFDSRAVAYSEDTVLTISHDITELKQTEKELREEKEKIKNYLDIAGVMILVLNEEGKIELINKRGCEILGSTEKAITGKNWFDGFIPKQDRELKKVMFLKLMSGETKSLEGVEGIIVSMTGEEKIISWHTTVIKDEEGKIIGTLSSGEDITEKKEAEELLQLTHFSIEHATDGMFWVDSEARFINFNEESCRSLGYSRDELLSMTVFDINPNYPPENWPRDWQELRKQGSIINQAKFKTKDGRFIPVEMHINYFDYSGKELLFGSFRDITERKRAEEALQASQLELQEKNVTLVAINRMADRLHQLRDEKTVAEAAVESMMEYSETRNVFFFTLKEDSEYFDLLYSNFADEETNRVVERLPVENGLMGMAMKQKEVLWSNDIISDNRIYESSKKQILRLDYKSLVIIPLIYQEQVLGTLALLFEEKRSLKEHEGEVFLTIGKTIGLAMSNARNLALIKERERELLASEEKYRTIVENSHTGIILVDDSYITNYVNDEICRISGYSREELINHDFREFLAPTSPVVVSYDKRKEGEDAPLRYEFDFFSKNGEIKNVEIISSVIKDNIGSFFTLSQLLDITDRKLAEEAILQERDKANKYLEVAGAIIVAVNERGEVTLINKKGREILGYKEEEIIGKNYFQEFLPERVRERVFKSFQKVFAGELEPTDQYENPILTKDGSERIISWYNTVLKDDTGKIIATLSSGEDITERKRAEESLKTSRLELQDRNVALETINRMANRLHRLQDKKSVIEAAAESMMEYSGSPLVSVRGVKEGTIFLEPLYISGLDEEIHWLAEREIPRLAKKIPIDSSLMGVAVKRRDVVWSSDISKDNRTYEKNRKLMSQLGYKSALMIPLAYQDHILGVMSLAFRESRSFKEHEIETFRSIGKTIGLAMSNANNLTLLKTSEEALRKSEEKYFTLVTNIPAVTWITNIDGTTSFISSNVEMVHGFTPEEIYQAKEEIYIDRIHPNDVEKVKERFEALFERNEPYDVEYRIQRKDGQWIWIQDRAITVYEEEGVKQAYGVFHDITKRKIAEFARQETEQLLQDILDNSTTVVFIKDLDGKYILVNRQFEKIFNLSREQILGKTVHDLFPDDIAFELQANDLQILNKKESVEFEEIVPQEDGMHTYLSVKFPLFNTEGEAYAICGISTDITERKKAEELLQLARFSIDHTVDSIVWVDSNARFIDVNEETCHFLGYSRDELLSMTVFDIDPNYPPENWLGDWQRLKKQGFMIGQSNYKTKDGRFIPVEMHINYFNYSGKELLFAFVRDITERRQVEEQLRESEQKFRSLAESSMVGVTIVQDDKIKYVNEAQTTINGYTKEEMEKWTVKEIVSAIHPEDVAFAGEQLMKKQKGEKNDIVPQYSFRIITKSGKIKWIDILSKTMMYGGKTANFITSIDITDRKRDEMARRETEQRLQDILDNSPTIVYLKDVDGKYLMINRKFEKLRGVSRDQIKEKTIFDVFPEDLATKLWANDLEVLKRKEAVEFEEVIPYEDEMNTFISVKFPLFNTEGEIYAICGISTDISVRKKAEEAVRKSEAQLREVIDHVPHLIYAKDIDGRHILVNKATADSLGLKPEDVAGKTYNELLDELTDDFKDDFKDQFQRFLAEDREVIESGKPLFIPEEIVIQSDGREEIFQTTTIPFISAGIPAALGVSINISETKKLQEEILEKNKLAAVGELAAGIAHELNTPLMNIDFTVEYIANLVEREPAVDGAHLKPELEDIQKQVQYCANIVKGLLQFSRKIDLVETTFPVKPLIDDIVESPILMMRMQEKGIDMRVEVEENLEITGDRNLILQVFQNLVNNAIDALPGTTKPPVIKVASSIDEQGVVMRVIDNGEGIQEKDLSKVFIPFFTTKPGEGTGLGLSICKSIIEKHEGEITVKSSPDKGTEVIVRLSEKKELR